MAWTIDDLETPAVLVDLDRVEANLARAQGYAVIHALGLRDDPKCYKEKRTARGNRQFELPNDQTGADLRHIRLLCSLYVCCMFLFCSVVKPRFNTDQIAKVLILFQDGMARILPMRCTS